MSTKLKLLGVDVASFGDAFAHRRRRAHAVSSSTPSPASTRSWSSSADSKRLLGGILVGDAVGLRPAARAWCRARRRCRRTPEELIVPRARAAGAAAWASTRCRDGAIICSLQQRRQGRHLRSAIARRSCTPSPALKACTKAGTGCGSCVPLVAELLKAELQEGRRRRQPPPLRALPALAPGAVPPGAAARARRPSTSCIARHGTRPRAARSASRRWRRSSPRPGTSTSSTTKHAAAAGHQRPLPRQHPARRHLLGGAARAGRRDHARPADRARPGRQALRPLHQDHRRPARRPVRRARRAAAANLARADRRRLRVGPRLRQGAAHGEVVRRAAPGAATACRTRSASPSGSRTATRACAARTSSSRRVSGLRARVRRGAEQGLRHHRHREGLEPLRLRQRRHEAAARAAARHRPRRGDADPLPRPLPDVLRPHRRPAAAHRDLAQQARGRHRLPARR